jgi:hypothetical protein
MRRDANELGRSHRLLLLLLPLRRVGGERDEP